LFPNVGGIELPEENQFRNPFVSQNSLCWKLGECTVPIPKESLWVGDWEGVGIGVWNILGGLMEPLLPSVVVTGLFALINFAVVFFVLRKPGKQYGIAKLVGYIAILVVIAACSAGSFYELQGMAFNTIYSTITLSLLGVTLLVNLLTGVVLTTVKTISPALAMVHRTSTFITITSLALCAMFLVLVV
jgi:hypothetical protein